MNEDEPCFFWIDFSLNEDEQKIVAICENCQKTHKKENAWFWNHGYGDFDINCHICNCFIKQTNLERK